MGYAQDVQRAEAELAAAKSEYKAALAAAKKNLGATEEEHRVRVARCERAMSEADRRYSEKIASYAGGDLYIDRIVVRGCAYFITDGVQVSVEASGNVYTTSSTNSKVGVSVGGAVVGGLVAGPIGAVVGGKKNKVETVSTVHDARSLFITVTTPYAQVVMEGKPDEEGIARHFAAAIVTAASNAGQAVGERNREMARLMAELDAARSDTAAVFAARSALEYAKRNTGRMDAAQYGIDYLRATATPEQAAELAAARRAKRASGAKLVAVIVAAVLVGIVGVALSALVFFNFVGGAAYFASLP